MHTKGLGLDQVHLSVLLFDYKIVYIEVSLTVSKMRSNILRHISHIRYHSAGYVAPILASSLYFELLWKHERVHCSIVHGREIKYFRNILTFNVDAAPPRCLRQDRVPFRDLWSEYLFLCYWPLLFCFWLRQ